MLSYNDYYVIFGELMDLEARDYVTGQTWREKLEEMGMSIPDAQACFDRVADLQRRLANFAPAPQVQDHQKSGKPPASHPAQRYG